MSTVSIPQIAEIPQRADALESLFPPAPFGPDRPLVLHFSDSTLKTAMGVWVMSDPAYRAQDAVRSYLASDEGREWLACLTPDRQRAAVAVLTHARTGQTEDLDRLIRTSSYPHPSARALLAAAWGTEETPKPWILRDHTGLALAIALALLCSAATFVSIVRGQGQ